MKKFLTQYKSKLIILTIVLTVVLSVPLIGKATGLIKNQIDIITEIYEIIKEYHISNIDFETLTRGAINGMVEALDDPYTKYFNEEEYQAFISNIDGSFVGIGIYIQEKDEYIVVQSPISGSPAEAAGIKAGDLIIKVDGVNLRGKSTEEASDLIRGKEGTTVNLTLIRGDQEIDVKIVRANIIVPATEAKMLSNDIGYLKISSFNNQVDNNVEKNISELKNNGMNKLILDLRGNPGGYLNSVLRVAMHFIDNGTIVYVKNGSGVEQTISITGGVNWIYPMVVLIDGGSASASEILAGALKDYNKAVIVGENSFGKGTVQSLIALQNGGYLKLTVNEYFTPNKSKMDKVGIKPDYIVKGSDKQLQAALLLLEKNNGFKEFKPLLNSGWINESGEDYIALRDMVDYFNGSIKWNSVTKTIEITLGSEKAKLNTKTIDGLIVKEGRSFISVDKLNEIFEKMIITSNNNRLSIFYPQ